MKSSVLHPRWRLGARALPLLLTLALAWPMARTLDRASYGSFGRDQGIFQYVAWALGQGERDYIDLREINGPLIHLIHYVFQRLGGEDEHVFRCLDYGGQCLAFALTGWLVGSALARPTSRLTWLDRAGFAGLGWLALSAQLLLYSWWESTQRESFYNVFLLLAIGLQMRAQSPRPLPARWRELAFGAAGALSTLTWFGKPTCVLFSVLFALVLWLDARAPLRRGRAFVCALAGAALVCGGALLWLTRVGSVSQFVQIVFGEVPYLYRFIWHKGLRTSYLIPGHFDQLNAAAALGLLYAALVATKKLPVRALLAPALSVAGACNYFLQGKAFQYHMHPVTAGAALCLCGLLLAGHTHWTQQLERGGHRAARWRAGVAFVALSGLLAFAARYQSMHCAAAKAPWRELGRTAEARHGEAYLQRFQRNDFFPVPLRRAAHFLQQHTRPDERVQTYGMDPYLLFLARRLSATPFIYSFELNVDAALAGGAERQPDAAQIATILATRARHEQALLAALQKAPPAAFALLDKAPFSFPRDADQDFDAHCPDAAAWMRAHYLPGPRFGAVRLWFRRDVHARERLAEPSPAR